MCCKQRTEKGKSALVSVIVGSFMQRGSPGLYQWVDVLVLTHDAHSKM